MSSSLIGLAGSLQFDGGSDDGLFPPRDFRPISSSFSQDYVVNLSEQGLITPVMDGLLEIFRFFRVISIQQASAFLLPQYSLDAHRQIATEFARLYYHHFIDLVSQKNMFDGKDIFPLPSLSFTLGPAGARYLISKHNITIADLGWSKTNRLRTRIFAKHDLTVTEIVLQTIRWFEQIRGLPGLVAKMDTLGEWEGRIFYKNMPQKKVLVRPDYSFMLVCREIKTDQMHRYLYFLEYDNGTEKYEVLLKKIRDYAVSVQEGRYVLGNPKIMSGILMVFNDENRMTNFARLLASRKAMGLEAARAVYLINSQELLKKGMFLSRWIKCDLSSSNSENENTQSAEDDAVPGSFALSESSLFPEISDYIQKTPFADFHASLVDMVSGYPSDYFIQLESEEFTKYKKEPQKPSGL